MPASEFQESSGGERQLSRIRKWRSKGRVVLMVAAFVLAARLFLTSSGQRFNGGSIPEPEGEVASVGLSLEQVRGPLKEAALLASHCQPPPGMAAENVMVEVAFEESGQPGRVEVLTEGVRGTEAADCIELNFHRVRLPSFTGAELLLRQGFSLSR